MDFNLQSNWWVSQLQKSEFAVRDLDFEKLGLGLDNRRRTTKTTYCCIFSLCLRPLGSDCGNHVGSQDSKEWPSSPIVYSSNSQNESERVVDRARRSKDLLDGRDEPLHEPFVNGSVDVEPRRAQTNFALVDETRLSQRLDERSLRVAFQVNIVEHYPRVLAAHLFSEKKDDQRFRAWMILNTVWTCGSEARAVPSGLNWFWTRVCS